MTQSKTTKKEDAFRSIGASTSPHSKNKGSRRRKRAQDNSEKNKQEMVRNTVTYSSSTNVFLLRSILHVANPHKGHPDQTLDVYTLESQMETERCTRKVRCVPRQSFFIQLECLIFLYCLRACYCLLQWASLAANATASGETLRGMG